MERLILLQVYIVQEERGLEYSLYTLLNILILCATNIMRFFGI